MWEHIQIMAAMDDVNEKWLERPGRAHWQLENFLNLPRQLNKHDCGMFLIRYMIERSRNQSMRLITQLSMPYYWKTVVLELLDAQLKT